MYNALQHKIKEVANNPEVNELVDALNQVFHNMHEAGKESLKAKIRWNLELDLENLKDIAECLDDRNKTRVLRIVHKIKEDLEYDL